MWDLLRGNGNWKHSLHRSRIFSLNQAVVSLQSSLRTTALDIPIQCTQFSPRKMSLSCRCLKQLLRDFRVVFFHRIWHYPVSEIGARMPLQVRKTAKPVQRICLEYHPSMGWKQLFTHMLAQPKHQWTGNACEPNWNLSYQHTWERERLAGICPEAPERKKETLMQ